MRAPAANNDGMGLRQATLAVDYFELRGDDEQLGGHRCGAGL